MPDYRAYSVLPDRPLEVLVETRDGAKALVRGTLRSVPEAMSGGVAIRLRIVDAVATPVTDE